MGFFSRAKPRANDDDFSFRAAGAEADFGDDDPINAVRSYSGASPSGQIRGQTIGAQTSSLMVAVRCRPLLAEEHLRGVRKDIIRVMDDRMIVVWTPTTRRIWTSSSIGARSGATRSTAPSARSPPTVTCTTPRRRVSSRASSADTTAPSSPTAPPVREDVHHGRRARRPRHDVALLVDIFDAVRRMSKDYVFEVTCSYLEVYNELIYDSPGAGFAVPGSP